jgi:hypothetical protein
LRIERAMVRETRAAVWFVFAIVGGAAVSTGEDLQRRNRRQPGE